MLPVCTKTCVLVYTCIIMKPSKNYALSVDVPSAQHNLLLNVARKLNYKVIQFVYST